MNYDERIKQCNADIETLQNKEAELIAEKKRLVKEKEESEKPIAFVGTGKFTGQRKVGVLVTEYLIKSISNNIGKYVTIYHQKCDGRIAYNIWDGISCFRDVEKF